MFQQFVLSCHHQQWQEGSHCVFLSNNLMSTNFQWSNAGKEIALVHLPIRGREHRDARHTVRDALVGEGGARCSIS